MGTKSPTKNIYLKLRNDWHKLKKTVDENMEKIKTFNYNCDPILKELAIEAREKCEDLMKRNFIRGDYEYLIKLIYIFLGGKIDKFTFRQPSACHEARFMADSLYILVLYMTSEIISQLNEDLRPKFKLLAEYISIFHGIYFLQTPITEKSPKLDLKFIKDFDSVKHIYGESTFNCILKSYSNHSWYLTENLVIISIADTSLDDDERNSIAGELLKYDRKSESHLDIIKPNLPDICINKDLKDYVGQRSWQIFNILELEERDLVWLKFPCRTFLNILIEKLKY